MASMNQGNGSMKYVTTAPTSQMASMKSKYDWKSVQAQKYFKSKSKTVKQISIAIRVGTYQSVWKWAC